jgi:hypothetical protein
MKTKREKKLLPSWRWMRETDEGEKNCKWRWKKRERDREKDCVCNRETTIDFEGNLKFEFET